MSPNRIKIRATKIIILILIWLVLTTLGYQLIFKSLNIYKLSHTIPMVLLVFFTFLISIHINLKLFDIPKLNKAICILLVLGISYIVILFILAFLRLYYSRPFLLYSFIVSYLAIYWAVGFSKNKVRVKYLLIYPDYSIREQELKEHGVDFIGEINKPNEELDGIVLKDFSLVNEPKVAQLVTKELFKGLPLFSFAELYASITGKIPLEIFRPELIRTKDIPIAYVALKRLFERFICIIFFVPALLLGLLISLLIIMNDGLPIFFCQERIGYKGHTFRLIKFRTMKKDAESNGPAFAQSNDNRFTRVGKLIRKLRLDELPQIINIIKGEMSLIGPRPEQIPFARAFEKTIPFYSLRYNVLPGLTGWAQVHSGYAANLDQTKEKLEYDLYYLFNQSIFLDLIILFKTIKIILTGHGAV